MRWEVCSFCSPQPPYLLEYFRFFFKPQSIFQNHSSLPVISYYFHQCQKKCWKFIKDGTVSEWSGQVCMIKGTRCINKIIKRT